MHEWIVKTISGLIVERVKMQDCLDCPVGAYSLPLWWNGISYFRSEAGGTKDR